MKKQHFIIGLLLFTALSLGAALIKAVHDFIEDRQPEPVYMTVEIGGNDWVVEPLVMEDGRCFLVYSYDNRAIVIQHVKEVCK